MRLAPIPHGTVGGYTNYGCRESCCREAVNAYNRERARKSRQHGADCPCAPCEARRRLDSTIERYPIPELDETWKDRANCIGVDTDLFFPGRGESNQRALAVCKGCEVRQACLDYAMARGEKFGIWGGTSERQRRRLRRTLRLAVVA